jgi:hypothetical protein
VITNITNPANPREVDPENPPKTTKMIQVKANQASPTSAKNNDCLSNYINEIKNHQFLTNLLNL